MDERVQPSREACRLRRLERQKQKLVVVIDLAVQRDRRVERGGAPCPVEVLEDFERRIGRPPSFVEGH
jgi:hypothetical protein